MPSKIQIDIKISKCDNQPDGIMAECSLIAASYKLCITNCKRHTRSEAERGKASNGEEITN